MRLFFLTLAAALATISLGAQNDSLVFFNGNWTSEQVGEGLTLRRCKFSGGLFDSAQTISVLEVKGRRLDIVEAPDRTLRKTTDFAKDSGAVAAVNAGFFITRAPYGSAMFYRQDYEDKFPNGMDGKRPGRSTRQTGAVVTTAGTLYIVKADRMKGWERYIAGEDVVTSGPLMIIDGREENVSVEGFNTTRHPRTGVGKKADGTVVFVVVDGRFKGQAEGMSIFELQKVMGWLGCESALNLDGGGSSTLVVGDRVINHPCDNKLYDHEGERKVHNAIIVR